MKKSIEKERRKRREDEVKAELRGRLGLTGGDFDKVWQLLEEHDPDQIVLALAQPETAASDLAALVQDRKWPEVIRSMGGRPKPRGRRRAEPVEVKLADHEAKYVEFLSWHLARSAEQLFEVQRFRVETLGGGVLAEKDALEYLKRQELEVYGLPKDPDSMTEEELELAGEVWAMSKGELLATWAPSLAAGLGSYDEHLFPRDRELGLIDWPDGWGWDKREDKRVGWDAGREQPRWRNRMDPTERPSLADLGRWLATLYPWRPTDAIWFVLTGEPPEVVGAELSYHHQRNLFTLVFAPWVSEKTIERAYRGAREHLGMGGYRPLEDKTVDALRFVHENTHRSTQKRVPWKKLMSLWNQRYPKQRFPFMESFRQACLRAEEMLGIRERDERGAKTVRRMDL